MSDNFDNTYSLSLMNDPISDMLDHSEQEPAVGEMSSSSSSSSGSSDSGEHTESDHTPEPPRDRSRSPLRQVREVTPPPPIVSTTELKNLILDQAARSKDIQMSIQRLHSRIHTLEKSLTNKIESSQSAQKTNPSATAITAPAAEAASTSTRPPQGVTSSFVRGDIDPEIVLRRATSQAERISTRKNWRKWVTSKLIPYYQNKGDSHPYIALLQRGPYLVRNICCARNCNTCDLDHACDVCMALLNKYNNTHTYGPKCLIYKALRSTYESTNYVDVITFDQPKEQ